MRRRLNACINKHASILSKSDKSISFKSHKIVKNDRIIERLSVMHYFMSQTFDQLVLVAIIHQYINDVTLTRSLRASTKYPILEIFPLTLSISISHILETLLSNGLKFGSITAISPKLMYANFYDVPLKTVGNTRTSFGVSIFFKQGVVCISLIYTSYNEQKLY
jgi:hypothetical protein